MRSIPLKIRRKARRIKLLLLDVDGVLTDGGIVITPLCEEVKRFDVRDGLGIKLWMQSGHQVGILTSRSSPAVRHRARELGIRMVYQKVSNKAEAYKRIKGKTGLTDSEIAYVGDDIVDLPVLKRVGLAIAVKDAAEDLKGKVDFLTKQNGGQGVVREVVEVILQAQGRWEGLLREYLK